MYLYIFNRLNDDGIRYLLDRCCILAKWYELESYGKIRNFSYVPEGKKCRISVKENVSFTAGGSYTFSLDGKESLGKKWYELYLVTWHFYKENPATGKYEEAVSTMVN